jgi:signal transduction histidine kinase
VGFDSVEDLPGSLRTKLGKLPGPLAVVPLWAHAHLRGVAVLIRAEGTFSPSILKLLTAAGRQLALAAENSQLLSDLQNSFRKLLDTQEELIRSERLAAISQLSATMAHEIRNPLATIFSAVSQIRKHGNVEGTFATLLDIAEEEATREMISLETLK